MITWIKLANQGRPDNSQTLKRHCAFNLSIFCKLVPYEQKSSFRVDKGTYH